MDDKQVDKILSILFSPGEWFQVPYRLLRVSSPNEAIMICYLNGQSHRFTNDGGWFYRTIESAEREIGIKEDTQRRIIKRLETRGWLKTKRKGIPALRYFKVNMRKVAEDILEAGNGMPEQDPAETQGMNPAETQGTYPVDVPDRGKGDLSREKKVKRKGGRAKPSQSSGDESGFFRNESTRKKRGIPAKSNLTEFDIDWGNRIRGLMVEHDTDLSNGRYKTSGETFAKQIRKLRISRERTESEITDVLGWYITSFAEITYPKMSKASDLCDRFQAMCDAKETSGKRRETAKKNGEVPKDKHSRLGSDVASACMNRWGYNGITQEHIDEVLKEMGHPAGMFDTTITNS